MTDLMSDNHDYTESQKTYVQIKLQIVKIVSSSVTEGTYSFQQSE
jgi:hypothetical protein